MKKIILAAFLLTNMAFATTCDEYLVDNRYDTTLHPWGDSVDVYMKETVTFAFQMEKNQSMKDFNTTIDFHVGFECFEESKYQKGSCLLLEYSWVPGADYSGCDINLYLGKDKIGSSEMFMMY